MHRGSSEGGENERRQVGAAAKRGTGQEKQEEQNTRYRTTASVTPEHGGQRARQGPQLQVPGLSWGEGRLSVVMVVYFNVSCLFFETGFHYYSPG